MKKLLLLFLVIVALSACSSKTNVEKSDASSTLDTAALVQRVTDIYEVALKQYNDMDAHGSAENLINLDSLFCSDDWSSWVKRVNAYDRQAESGMGFFEADYWIMGQDWNDLNVTDIRVTAMTDSTATVELNLHNCGNVTAVRLEMLFENGAWNIDNFIDVTNDFDWKAGMKEYMSDNK